MTNDSSVFIWDLRNSQPIDELLKHSDIYSLKMMPNDKELYVGSSSNYVSHVELPDKVVTPLEPPHLDTVSALSMLGGNLVSGSRDQNLRFWDPLTRTCSSTITHAHKASITCLGADARYVYSGCKDGLIKAWELPTVS